jgi:rRNA maturation endonuclease Nob1
MVTESGTPDLNLQNAATSLKLALSLCAEKKHVFKSQSLRKIRIGCSSGKYPTPLTQDFAETP